MALDWCQNFVSIQYLENKLMDFDEILCMQYYKPDLGENVSYSVKLVIYRVLSPDSWQNHVPVYWILSPDVKIIFQPNVWKQMVIVPTVHILFVNCLPSYKAMESCRLFHGIWKY